MSEKQAPQDPPPPYQPAGQATGEHAGFNKGARFDDNTPASIPPPPPGGKPTPAQMTGQTAVSGTFDQGARFDPNKPATIPPPPPGVAPTAAQQAAAQGQNVVMSQQKKDNWGMGSDGGAAFF